MLRPNRITNSGFHLLGGAAALWIAGCASEPPVLYPGPTPTVGYSDYGYSNYVDDGIYYQAPLPFGGGYFYAPYGPVIVTQGAPTTSPGAPVFRPPSANGPSFHPPGAPAPAKPPVAPVGRAAPREPCVRISRVQSCR